MSDEPDDLMPRPAPDPEQDGTWRWNGSEWTQVPPSDDGRRDGALSSAALWTIAGTVAVLVVLIVTVLVLAVSRIDSPGNEDDEAEFREVSVTACEPPDVLSAQQVRGVAENGSSKRSDYAIEIAVFSADGTRIGTGSTTVRDVEPGQRAVWSSDTDTAQQDWDDGSTCKVLSVERTASF